MSGPNERQRFLDQLPFYVNGTLDEAQMQWMREQLARQPQWADQVRLQEVLQERVREDAEAVQRAVPLDVGYGRLAARLAAERAAPRPVGAWQRLAAWWREPAPQGGLRWAQGLALGVIVGAGALLTVPTSGPEPAAVRGTPSGAARGLADGPLLRVNFDPRASENDIRLALIDARVMIVAGPTRLGDYYLKPAAGQLAAALAALQRAAAVHKVSEVPGLPPDLLE